MNKNIIDFFSAFVEDNKIFNENIEELKNHMNLLIDEHNTLTDNYEKCNKLFVLIERRMNKMELVITKIQQQLPKTKSFDYLPIPQNKSSGGII